MNLQEAGDAPRMRHVGSSQPTGSVMTNGGDTESRKWLRLQNGQRVA